MLSLRYQKKHSCLLLAAVVFVCSLASVSDSAPQTAPAAPLKLSRILPKGALAFAQFRDLAGQFRLWRTSKLRESYYASKNYSAFQQSRLFLKLQSRTAEFESALGFPFTEENLAMVAGGESAVGVYDLGKLELVAVSEMPREKAFATVLYANAKNFDERTAPGGAVYYVREFNADGGREVQRVGFSYVDGKLIFASSESLLLRAVENALTKETSDRLSEEIAPAVSQSRGFAPHDVTLWLQQARLNSNLYFRSYWVHRNLENLAKYDTALIDLQMTSQEWKERRWFALASRPPETGTSAPRTAGARASQLVSLTRFAPADAQLVEARSTYDGDPQLVSSISRTLFGELPEPGAAAAAVPSQSSSESSSENGERPPGMYRNLDSRFDRDIDDEAAVKLSGAANERTAAAERFGKALLPILSGGKPVAYSIIQAPELGADGLFVKLNRALVVELGSGSALDTRKLEAVIGGELQTRFVAGGSPERLVWQSANGVRSIRQALLEQGGAYALSGSSLIIASNADYCSKLLAHAATPVAPRSELGAQLTRFSLVRPGLIMPAYAKLTRVLDAKPPQAADAGSGDSEENTESNSFFSDNLASLLGLARIVSEASLESHTMDGVLREVVTYRLAGN